MFIQAIRRAAVAVKLAEVAREELPNTMATIHLFGVDISDFTLNLK